VIDVYETWYKRYEIRRHFVGVLFVLHNIADSQHFELAATLATLKLKF